jgi:hypothetical protein
MSVDRVRLGAAPGPAQKLGDELVDLAENEASLPEIRKHLVWSDTCNVYDHDNLRNCLGYMLASCVELVEISGVEPYKISATSGWNGAGVPSSYIRTPKENGLLQHEFRVATPLPTENGNLFEPGNLTLNKIIIDSLNTPRPSGSPIMRAFEFRTKPFKEGERVETESGQFRFSYSGESVFTTSCWNDRRVHDEPVGNGALSVGMLAPVARAVAATRRELSERASIT